MPKELVGRIFEPFFTTKEAGVGTGLGLSISHGIVASFGGELTLETEDGKGTRFRISLPPAPREHGETRATPRVATILRGRILVVDDETMILRVLKRVLADHEVVLAESAEEALTLLERDARFDVIISDLVLPTMTGMAFYEVLLGRNPDLARHVIFMTGGAVTKKLEAFLGSVQNSFIEKPFNRPSLLRTVQEHLVARAAVH
jgi:CheY-like chemotaxis protein